MELAKKIDKTLEGWYKGAPKISNASKETLAKIWPWLALVAGIFELLMALSLWRLARVVDRLGDVYDYYGVTGYTYSGLSSTDKAIIYVGLLFLLVVGIMMLVAFPKLKARQKGGWNLLFGAALLNIAYAVVSVFINGRGIGSLIGSLIGSAIGFWLLFVVKEKFGGNVVIPASDGPRKPTSVAPKADEPNDDKK